MQVLRYVGVTGLLEDLQRKIHLHEGLVEALGDLDVGVSRVESELAFVTQAALNEKNQLQQLHVSLLLKYSFVVAV